MKEDKILAVAKDRLERADEFEQYVREMAEDDLRFVAGEQWPDGIKEQRDADERPTLTINRLPTLIAQAVSAARRSNLAIRVAPTEGGDADIAEIYAGLIRHIEQTSHADQAYDTGFQLAAECGIGYWRINTDYATETSFNQEIRIERILNPFSVYFDPDAERYDKSDARWCFVSDWVRREDLEADYPDADLSSFGSESDEWGELWHTDERYRVVEYWDRSDETYTLALLSTGETVELTEDVRAWLDMMPDVQIIQDRKAERQTVTWRKLCGGCVLDGPQTWTSKYLPIIPCYGPEYLMDGRVYYRSLIRAAKDPQRQYNYWQSAITEKIALAPKSPWIGTPRMFEGLEHIWDRANQENLSYLPYNPDPSVPGGPQRNSPASVNPAEIQQAAQAIDDIKATTGIFDASLGNQATSRDESGVALMGRLEQGNEATYPWLDNLRRSVEHTGRVIVDMIPRLYDAERVVRVLGEDGAESLERINQQNPVTGEKINDLTTGSYDVVVKTGPSYASQRAAASAILLKMMQLPQIAPVAAHMLAEQMDIPQARKMSRYLKRSLPAGILDPDDPDAPQQPQGPSPQEQAAQALSQAEVMKAQAAAMKAQTDARKTMSQIPGEIAETKQTQLQNAKLALELAQADGTLQALVGQQVQQVLAQLFARPIAAAANATATDDSIRVR